MGLAQLVPRRRAHAPDSYSEGWAWVRVRGAFFPDVIEARPGERLRLVFRREETAACSERVVVPSLGKSVMLPPFEDVTVDLGPMPPGEHEFRCELGILRGRIIVRGEPAPSFAAPDNPDRKEVTQMSPTETDPRVTEKAAMSHDGADPSAAEGKKHGHRGHSHWMMIACCVPMLLIAVFLLAGGVGLAALIPFLFCAAMMVVMMAAMGDGRR